MDPADLVIELPDGTFAEAAHDLGDGTVAPIVIDETGAPCCCDDIGNPGCNAENLCIEVEFDGVEVNANFSGPAYCQDALPELLATFGYNRMYRRNGVSVSPGSVIVEFESACGVQTAVRNSIDPTCDPDPGLKEIAPGAKLILTIACSQNQLYLTGVVLRSLTLTEAGAAGCSVTGFDTQHMDFQGGSIRYFTWDSGGQFTTPLGADLTVLDNQNPSFVNPGNGVYTDDIQGANGIARVRLVVLGNCSNPNTNSIARKCDNPSVAISVDATTLEPGEYGVIYQDELYRLTSESTTDPAVQVQSTSQTCQAPSQLYRAIRCRNTGTAIQDPLEIAYLPNPNVGVGNGNVVLITQLPDDCVRFTYYRATAEPTTGVAMGAHGGGDPCANIDDIYCRDSIGDRPGDISRICDPGGLCDGVGPGDPGWLIAFCDRVCRPRGAPVDPRVLDHVARQAGPCDGCGQ